MATMTPPKTSVLPGTRASLSGACPKGPLSACLLIHDGKVMIGALRGHGRSGDGVDEPFDAWAPSRRAMNGEGWVTRLRVARRVYFAVLRRHGIIDDLHRVRQPEIGDEVRDDFARPRQESLCSAK